ncbi:MAG: hypothetical protein M1834_002504 [Cirrosporium novae-zelandiae]|nr:MAG: hypothetical protein M1834_002504 [Cirrosporium novae-zelandiae]
MADEKAKTSSMDSSFPVDLPENPSIYFSQNDFDSYIHDLLHPDGLVYNAPVQTLNLNRPESPLPKAESSQDGEHLASQSVASSSNAFMDALREEIDNLTLENPTSDDLLKENKMFTENMGIAYHSTTSINLDLFHELEKNISGDRLQTLLDGSWSTDPDATLRIVWNTRSIHLGKGERESFYRCLGWMKNNHPETVIKNLQWTFRSVIEKKVDKPDDEQPVMVEKELLEIDDEYKVIHGVSHGYWKDLLNILVLAVNNKLDISDPRELLNKVNEKGKGMRSILKRMGKVGRIQKKKQNENKEKKKRIAYATPELGRKAEEVNTARQKLEAKALKHIEEAQLHSNAVNKLESDLFYLALHLSVARLFADRLRKDMDLLNSGTKQDLLKVSLAAKWAPSLEKFHDKHTFIATTIAEILYPRGILGQNREYDNREAYLKHAREQYRAYCLSPLRKVLEVVERDITAETFANIKYDRIPSIAMQNYQSLFAQKDTDRFENYISRVAEGKSRISGAVLMPATLVAQAITSISSTSPKSGSVKKPIDPKLVEIQSKVANGQWNTLIKRIKDSGSLSNSIAVCDVSGSMNDPKFPDGTCPLHSAIGLSLLISEITNPPFGGTFISFSEQPAIHHVGGPSDTRIFPEKVSAIVECPWGFNTNFIAVFENLILPMAISNNLKPDDMVKQVFVFSDMQFDQADHTCSYPIPSYVNSGDPNLSDPNQGKTKWETHYERLKRKFEDAGYEIPQLIFWNLAGGRAGSRTDKKRHEVAPKPVTADVPGTALVSGYSQGQMKMFLDDGSFGDEEDEVEVVDTEMETGEDDDVIEMGMVDVKVQKKKKKMKPEGMMRKAIGHKAYDMLKVYD